MLSDRIAGVLAVVAVMLVSGTALAQKDALQVPALRSDLLDLRFEEVPSQPAPTDRTPDFARCVATFRTPVIPEQTRAFHDPLNEAAKAATRSLRNDPALSYEQRRKLPTSDLTHAGLIQRAIITDEWDGRMVIEWTVYGVDRPMVELLVGSTIGAYATAHGDEVRRIVEAWRRSQAHEAESALEREAIIPQIAAIEADLDHLGLANMSLGSMEEALADAERQYQLTRIELAGIEGQLRAVTDGLDGMVPDADTENARELRRLHVVLQVERAGASDRREFITNWIEALRSGRKATKRLDERKLHKARLEASARSAASSLSDLSRQAAELARAAEFHVLDNRVVVSPVPHDE